MCQGLGRTVLGERDSGTIRPCEILVVLQESQGHVRHRLMRPIILRNVPQQSRIAVRVDEVSTEDVPGWSHIGVTAAMQDREDVVEGKSVSVRVDICGSRRMNTTNVIILCEFGRFIK